MMLEIKDKLINNLNIRLILERKIGIKNIAQ